MAADNPAGASRITGFFKHFFFQSSDGQWKLFETVQSARVENKNISLKLCRRRKMPFYLVRTFSSTKQRITLLNLKTCEKILNQVL